MHTLHEHPEVIRGTQQVSLRRLRPHNAAELYDIVDLHREYLAVWLPWPNSTTRESSLQRAEKVQDLATELHYVIYVGTSIAGAISFNTISQTSAEIGYWLSPNYTGRHITTMAVNLLSHYGFSQLGLSFIEIRTDPKNFASQQIALNNGYSLYKQSEKEHTYRKLSSQHVLPLGAAFG